ncbi:MAG: hypothetical protein RLZZ165_982, partial [Bacteroidota bacterium]
GRATTRFVWDGDVLLHEWKSVEGRAPDPDDVVTWLFEPGGFVPAAKLKGDRQYSILADPLGTPTRIHDAEGWLVWHRLLDACGRETCLKGEAGACPFCEFSMGRLRCWCDHPSGDVPFFCDARRRPFGIHVSPF